MGKTLYAALNEHRLHRKTTGPKSCQTTTGYITFGKALLFDKPQFLCLQNGDAYYKRCLLFLPAQYLNKDSLFLFRFEWADSFPWLQN